MRKVVWSWSLGKPWTVSPSTCIRLYAGAARIWRAGRRPSAGRRSQHDGGHAVRERDAIRPRMAGPSPAPDIEARPGQALAEPRFRGVIRRSSARRSAVSTWQGPKRIIAATLGATDCRQTADTRTGQHSQDTLGRKMLDAFRIDLGPFVVVLVVVTAIIGGVVYALYAGIGRLISFLERHDE